MSTGAKLEQVQLTRILHSQGFGSRRECAARIARGEVCIGGSVQTDADADVSTDGLVLEVEGRAWPYCAHALVMLHKPAGTECSRQPGSHPSVLSLLPLPLRQRGLQPVGRLDQDTTGLLLLTDDGALNHRLTSPRHHVAKVYQVTTRHPVDAAQRDRLLAGVVLHDDPAPVRAAACRITGEQSLELTITDGRYHQVKRMLAAVGNRVEGLHRSAIGGVALPDDLAPGGWRWLDGAERDRLSDRLSDRPAIDATGVPG